MKLLVELRDVSGRKQHDTAVKQRDSVLRSSPAKKPTLLARLAKAGL